MTSKAPISVSSIVKLPVSVIVFVALVVVTVVVYIFFQTSKIAEDVVTNDKINLENEKLGCLLILMQVIDWKILKRGR